MKRVLITGAGAGIGLAVAKKFAVMGWYVLSLDKIFKEASMGEEIIFDLRDLDGIPGLIDRIGPVDTLVNNAAVLFCDPIESIPKDHMQEILDVNLLAPAKLIEATSKAMKLRGSGRIVS
ncbi:MAG: SDR family oxidoreductase, partial [Betaproteobacteria bacterium]|nr:SDR family oxidoreductase [Betaproteobacteria bacterium]